MNASQLHIVGWWKEIALGKGEEKKNKIKKDVPKEGGKSGLREKRRMQILPGGLSFENIFFSTKAGLSTFCVFLGNPKG